MLTMKSLLLIIFMATAPSVLFASTAVQLDQAPINLLDKDSIANGAKLYVQYCSSCHSLKHMRYSRIADDYAIDEAWMKDNIVPNSRKVHDSMLTAMNSEDARVWFGMPPPDLSLIARAKGVDWLYSYLHGFYIDEKKPYGVNNLVSPDVAMPDVLAPLGGVRELSKSSGETDTLRGRLRVTKAGMMNSSQFDKAVTD
ncbi:MAG TPA: cytochrome c1, partial [Crenotrichaceae bacterium]|nr:cytochrome c1 [Crenotrichaceae bacterium]